MKSLLHNKNFLYPMIALILLAIFFGVMSFLAVKPANASGSDGALPYTVTADGIQLPDGVVFADGGHVNTQTNQGDRGIHFEALNDQPSGQWIGKSFLPWSAFGFEKDVLCVSWVQVWLYQGHFGEGGQSSVGYGCGVLIPPVHTEVPEPTATPEPTSTPTPAPTPSGPPYPIDCYNCEPPTEPPFICAHQFDEDVIAGGGLTDEEKYWCAQFPPVNPPSTGVPVGDIPVGEAPPAPAAPAEVAAPVSAQPQLAETGADGWIVAGWIATLGVMLGLFTVIFRKFVFRDR